MSKTIFRRIGGRIVPISVEKIVKMQKHAEGIEISLHLREGFKRIGEVWAQQSAKRPGRFFVGSHLNPEFRGAGLGKEFYKMLSEQVKQFGGKTMVGTTANVQAIKKVREAVGKTRGFTSGKGVAEATTFVTLLKNKKSR